MQQFTLVMAQLNPLVGDIDGNADRVIEAVNQAREEHEATLVVFPELMLTGYPPEDLLLRPSLSIRVERAVRKLCAAIRDDIYVALGYPKRADRGLLNVVGVIHRGQVIAEYAKQALPNYRVFDEKRYFTAGASAGVVEVAGVPCALTVCEDIWEDHAVKQASMAGGELLLNINASPYAIDKHRDRQELLRRRAHEGSIPIIYVNMVGGQDELVFDGGSMVVDAGGELKTAAPQFEAGLFPVRVQWDGQRATVAPGAVAPEADQLASMYRALVLGVRDYVEKNGFKRVLLGLSGGIDSALSLAVAADALGPERVEAVMMPFHYTAEISVEDAEQQARTLGVHYRSLPIEHIYNAFMDTLSDAFAGTEPDLTEQNIQARCRGVLLMALSNKTGALVLTTGNKSELAVGYATLYGDMAGGFDVLKDVSKTKVFELARYRNSLSPVIPERVITRAPSAELAPGQVDEDNLPPYPLLDQILELYVEQDVSAEAIVAAGFEREAVERVVTMIDRNEYKRRQAPVGPRLTKRGFGRDRRYPITSGWRQGD